MTEISTENVLASPDRTIEALYIKDESTPLPNSPKNNTSSFSFQYSITFPPGMNFRYLNDSIIFI